MYIEVTGVDIDKDFWSVITGITKEDFYVYAHSSALPPSFESIEGLWEVWGPALGLAASIMGPISAMADYLGAMGVKTIEVDPDAHQGYPEIEGDLVFWVREVVSPEDKCVYLMSVDKSNYTKLRLNLSAETDSEERMELYKKTAECLHRFDGLMNIVFGYFPPVLRRTLAVILETRGRVVASRPNSPITFIKKAIASLAQDGTYGDFMKQKKFGST